MLFNFISTYIHYFKNLLDPETFVRLQELLEPPSKFAKMTDSMKNIVEKQYKKIKAHRTSYKEEYVVTEDVRE